MPPIGLPPYTGWTLHRGILHIGISPYNGSPYSYMHMAAPLAAPKRQRRRRELHPGTPKKPKLKRKPHPATPKAKTQARASPSQATQNSSEAKTPSSHAKSAKPVRRVIQPCQTDTLHRATPERLKLERELHPVTPKQPSLEPNVRSSSSSIGRFIQPSLKTKS